MVRTPVETSTTAPSAAITSDGKGVAARTGIAAAQQMATSSVAA
ncbi:hypothetical protein HDA45_006359 [Amycolatopsis umgeniensis]|uniref:Uncharacterized protein n=1 Tax=Amycolatopsis umgeniensis TaxID=336628 RepID=A0A841BCH9_9PSEU|nr:hypothetical protein [Amycolatopsis umgeniensis]